MKGDTVLIDPDSYRLLHEIAYMMESRNISSLPLKSMENWPDVSALEHLIESGLVKVQKGAILLDIREYQEIIWKKMDQKLRIQFPMNIRDCMGPPWTPEKRFLVDCHPRLDDLVYSISPNENTRLLIADYLKRTTLGIGVENNRPRPLENVIILPSFHEGDYLQHLKIKRAIRHYKPDFVAFEGLGPVGTRYLVLSCFTLRAFSGFPYCLITKPWVYCTDRIEFFLKNYREAHGTKFCLTAESDFCAVLASCIGLSIPFFPIGVPEECISLYFPEYFEIEKQAWEKCCKELENRAKQSTMWNLNSLCDPVAIEEMENIVVEGRVKAPLRYKEQLMWMENYMISRISDFLILACPGARIVVFVGLCHARAMEIKIRNGSWQYIPPINENVVPISIGFAPSKIAGYIQLHDSIDEHFAERLERAFSPSALFAEFFDMKEYDFTQFVQKNMKTAVYTDFGEEVAKRELLDLLLQFRMDDPGEYKRVMRAVENHIKVNGLNGTNSADGQINLT